MLVAWKYRPRETLIQRLDPRARLIFMVCVILAITLAQVWDIRLLLPLFILVLILYLLARIEWQDVRRAWLLISVILVFIIGLNALIAGRGGPMAVLQEASPVVLFQTPTLRIPFTPWSLTVTITVARAWFALTQFVRLLTMAMLAVPVAYTFDPSMYGVIFRRLGLPDKASYTMDLAFRFVPTLGRDFAITMDAQRARGYELERARGGIVERLRRLAPLLVPVTMQAIVAGEEVVDAMDLRAFGTRRRTWMRADELVYQPRDYVLIGLGVVILLGSLGARAMGFGDFWLPAALAAWAGG